MTELASELSRTIRGDVRFDRMSRLLYSTDASIYQIEPIGVVIPRDRDDVERTVRTCARAGVPLLPRGGGTSLAGQAVGQAVIVDLSMYMNGILELNREERWVRVQPGVVQDELGSYLKPHGLRFGPNTASSNRSNIGGMIGNNSAGSRSLLYGKTVDHVLDVKAILADGSEAVFSSVRREDLPGKARGESLEARIYRDILRIAEDVRAEVERRYPRIPRRVSGYNLDELLKPDAVNLAKLIVGSEGTLATVVEARLNLVPLPACEGLAVLHFDGLLPALETAQEALELSPAAVELVDHMVLDLARESLEYSRRLGFVRGRPHALIIVEFYGENESEIVSKLDALESRLGSRTTAFVRVLDKAERQNVWKVRKAALPLLLGRPGDHKPIAFVEDTAVAPHRLTEYIARFNRLLEKYRTVGSFYAHAGAGCLHIRPLINLKDAREVIKMRDLAEDVSDLVQEFGGAMSGEHGDGLARSHFNEKMFGPRLYRAFQDVKRAFDPGGLLNPGKVVNAPAMTENLRYGASYRTLELPTAFAYAREGGFARAVELCNGAGVCRKKTEGTMCPSYMVTLDEEHSTRGRANALRAVLDGRLPLSDLSSRRLYDVMDLCISCKGCKAECPSNVDMARLKSEFLALYHRDHPHSLRDRVFASASTLGRLGVATAPVANWLVERSAFRSALERWGGIDRRRSLPLFARESFLDWLGRHTPPPGRRRGRRGRVVLYHDTFMSYYEPEVGRAATLLLEACGFEVLAVPRPCCGRPAISKGMLDEARALARANVDTLHPYVKAGAAVVGCEPSCLLTLRDEYRDLAGGPEAEAVAASSFLLEEFLEREGLGALAFPNPIGEVLLHGHCHQKALVGTEPTVSLLGKTGARVREVDSGCCGMAGTFGYEREHFDWSLKMAERRLLPAVRSASPEVTVAAPGTSCRHQIKDGTGRRAEHPAEIVARAAGLLAGG